TPLMPIVDALAQQSPTTGVVLVPHGELDPVILAEAQARPDYGRRVVVLTDRSMDERPLVYRALDAMVAPVSAPGMHRSLLEALAMRLPVVAYDHPSIRGWIADRQTGRVVAVGDRSALVQALLEVLGARRLRRNMGAMARKAAEHRFDSESNRLRLFALYDALIRRNLVDP
ncbi:MAG: glycosyltransferase, partial [Myxococcota bacterium]